MKTRQIKNLIFILFMIGIIAGGITILDFLRIMDIEGTLKTDASDVTLWRMVIYGVGAIGTIILAVLFFVLFRNANKGNILEKRNVNWLKVLGNAVMYIGLACIVMIHAFLPTGSIETARYYLLVIFGGSFLFFAYIFEIGIKLKEEQELTV